MLKHWKWPTWLKLALISPALLNIAGRIKASQSDEIDFMEGWLTDRGESPMAHAHHMMSMHHKMEMGMATDDQMAALAAAESVDFDRQFLTLMIRHHEGAVDMVEDLLDKPALPTTPSCTSLWVTLRMTKPSRSTR